MRESLSGFPAARQNPPVPAGSSEEETVQKAYRGHYCPQKKSDTKSNPECHRVSLFSLNIRLLSRHGDSEDRLLRLSHPDKPMTSEIEGLSKTLCISWLLRPLKACRCQVQSRMSYGLPFLLSTSLRFIIQVRGPEFCSPVPQEGGW